MEINNNQNFKQQNPADLKRQVDTLKQSYQALTKDVKNEAEKMAVAASSWVDIVMAAESWEALYEFRATLDEQDDFKQYIGFALMEITDSGYSLPEFVSKADKQQWIEAMEACRSYKV